MKMKEKASEPEKPDPDVKMITPDKINELSQYADRIRELERNVFNDPEGKISIEDRRRQLRDIRKRITQKDERDTLFVYAPHGHVEGFMVVQTAAPGEHWAKIEGDIWLDTVDQKGVIDAFIAGVKVELKNMGYRHLDYSGTPTDDFSKIAASHFDDFLREKQAAVANDNEPNAAVPEDEPEVIAETEERKEAA